MANKMFRLGILVVALVFGMTVVGCGGSSSDGGVFTLTDIPAEYNGKYALFDGSFTDTGEDFVGCMNFNLSTEEVLQDILVMKPQFLKL